ncbi:uncharacterized protein LAJ45_04825 [Morchella importuna]|uniref:uncharacterized protein n=1 Tax=Morchella importuna TaxID=1174673 RepID=UPI001E8D9C7B|nr:uncharacterized protein LAJ45_04825 [Morchella importuna]KAH8151123.1 hypothetical protein LAJ45_04825 [Morchella importuna]
MTDRPATSPARSFTTMATPTPTPPPIPPPLDKASCITLVTHTLADARARGDPVTIDLSHQRIAAIPVEVLELVKCEIERLALAHNQLTGFSDEFAALPRLRYLNLRSNFLREFPAALTRLPSLEILDVSRNRLRALPADFGTLVNLKVLSMSKNKITTLPAYIGDMHDLKILKLDHNPLSFPPAAVLDLDGEETDRDAWLDNLKRFLRNGSSGSENDFLSTAATLVARPSTETLFSDAGNGNGDTIKPLKGGGVGGGGGGGMIGGEMIGGGGGGLEPTITPSVTPLAWLPKRRRWAPGGGPPNNSCKASRWPSSQPPSSPPGHCSPSRRRPLSAHAATQSPRSSTPGAWAWWARGASTPSSNTFAPSMSSTYNSRKQNTSAATPTTLPSSAAAVAAVMSVSSARIGEAARGILYAMSTLQGPIEEFVQSLTPAPAGDTSTIDTALYTANIHIGTLVSALEAFEETDEEAQVIDACYACVAAFKRVLALIRETGGAGCQEKRYVRTLLLMVYGSYIEIQHSYETLRPLLPGAGEEPPVTARLYAPPPPPLRLKNSSSVVSLPSTPRQDVFMLQPPPTPGLAVAGAVDGGFDSDEPLYGKFVAATTAATTTLPVIEREIKAAAGSVPNPAVALKLREVAALCVAGTEAARRLGMVKWEAVREGDVAERRRFWEETNKFTNLVINIAELIKSITQEHPFPKPTLIAVGTVVRPTKDLYILMNGSAFRHQQQQYAATPLSAALGVAMQATIPQMAGAYSAGRSGTMVSLGPQMGMGMGEVGMGAGAFGKGVRLT